MIGIIAKALSFGERRKIKSLEKIAIEVNALEADFNALTDAQLRQKTDEFRSRLIDGETLDDILPEAFAAVRAASMRTLGMRHFDVQLMGGAALHQGKIAEMKTGEGKTLVGTLPTYLNAIEGKGVHLVTVNDYLAKRDSEWMTPIYSLLGLTVGIIQNNMDPSDRVRAYAADITFGTNNEFGFDYLRDNMARDIDHVVQRGHNFAIVDEVDSILIDEARTPLIISGATEQAANTYYAMAKIIPRLIEGVHYDVDEKLNTIAPTEEGISRVEEMLGIDNLYGDVNSQLINHLNQGLKAHRMFKNEVDYIVRDGEVVIVDEFTGRLMDGRRYSEGLHQAIEAKEGVKIKEENQTLATITLQNYFRMYDKLAGMTGTAKTEATEFLHIYKLDTVEIPTNQDMIREDQDDLIYKTETAKFNAVVEDIAEHHRAGQPVLVGTISIENSEKLSRELKKAGVTHEVLNAKYHEREAEIISQAGRPAAVTIATNMAGRGVDIILGGNPAVEGDQKKVVEAGGLYVIGTERHDSRRIDNQLRGRSGRQGDPGASRFYLSVEDELMRKFAAERIGSLMDRLGLPEDQPINHPLISRSIETAQRQVESQNFETRKYVLKYDDVMNTQRQVIYEQRQRILRGEDLHDHSLGLVEEVITRTIAGHCDDENPDNWDLGTLETELRTLYPMSVDFSTFDRDTLVAEELTETVVEDAIQAYQEREDELGAETLRELERQVLLDIIDNRWKDHLYEMDYLREGINLRAFAQRDPLVEYQREGFDMFQTMIEGLKDDFVRYIYHLRVMTEEERHEHEMAHSRRWLAAVAAGGDSDGRNHTPVSVGDKVGRNDPCPCGSGKKFKKCHGLTA